VSTPFSLVLTTYSRSETGSRITAALLSTRLAACVQVFPMRSAYRWKGKLVKEREYLMLIKARTKRFGKVKETILANHDYETPEVIALRIDRVHSAYGRWMSKVTR
jgi:periplasmic divalent cation tolerance protein